MQQVVIIMGSKIDLSHAKKITKILDTFQISYTLHIASAHKVPLKVLDIIKENENEETIFLTIAGRSNALSGFVDAQTSRPVIACPPYNDKFAGADLYSTLRMPSGVAPLTILEPNEAGLACAKILALTNPELKTKITKYQNSLKKDIETSDKELTHG